MPTLPAKVDKPAQIYTIIVQCPADQRSGVQAALIDLGTFTVTAYSATYEDCGKTDGITKSGVKAVEGITIAADWSVLPKGTIVYIDSVGYRTSEDTGSKVKGNHIDIFMNDHQSALNFGKQELNVWIISQNPEKWKPLSARNVESLSRLVLTMNRGFARDNVLGDTIAERKLSIPFAQIVGKILLKRS
jgi:3D (Asp-Asp-Asp) domain-containing protein